MGDCKSGTEITASSPRGTATFSTYFHQKYQFKNYFSLGSKYVVFVSNHRGYESFRLKIRENRLFLFPESKSNICDNKLSEQARFSQRYVTIFNDR